MYSTLNAYVPADTARRPDTETHEISTPYYNASIPIWRDSLPTTPSSISAWKTEWKAPEAGEVVQAVGAWVFCFRKPRIQNDLNTLRTILSTINEVIEHHSQSSYSTTKPLLLAVGMQQTITPSLEIETEEWEDLCRECGGWEWIDGTLEGYANTSQEKKTQEQEVVNEYGEKVGMARLKEALEANEWEYQGGDDFEDLDDLGLGGDDANLGFGEETIQAQMEMWEMQSAIREEGQGEEMGKNNGEEEGNEVRDQDVQELEGMMLKMQAVRDMGADMPEDERKKFAANAVRDVLKKI